MPPASWSRNMMHAEAKEGIGAFIEKRAPVWDEELSAAAAAATSST